MREQSAWKVIVQQAPPTVIKIEPANPQVVYVPTYNPTVVYGAIRKTGRNTAALARAMKQFNPDSSWTKV